MKETPTLSPPAITFTIPLPPQSLQFAGKRIRIVRIGGKHLPKFYLDKKAEEYMAAICEYSRQFAPKTKLHGPVELELTFVLPRPKTSLRPEVAALPGMIRMDGRPDWDNLAKGTQDALGQAGFWHDDGQVSDAIVRKRYAEDGPSYKLTPSQRFIGKPRIIVSMREVSVDANILAIYYSESLPPPRSGGHYIDPSTLEPEELLTAQQLLQRAAKSKAARRKAAAKEAAETADIRQELAKLDGFKSKAGKTKHDGPF